MKVSALVRRIRKDLGDCDGNRYEGWHIMQIASEVACTLFGVAKDAFVKPREITVTGGELIDLSGCCDFIQRVDGIVDGNGNLLQPIKTVFESPKAQYVRAGCKSAGGLPTEATIVNKEGKHIKLSPPLPPTKSVKIRVWCASSPKFNKLSDEIDLPCELTADFIKLIKATLLEADDDSASGMNLSNSLTSKAGQMILAMRNQRKEYAKET